MLPSSVKTSAIFEQSKMPDLSDKEDAPTEGKGKAPVPRHQDEDSVHAVPGSRVGSLTSLVRAAGGLGLMQDPLGMRT